MLFLLLSVALVSISQLTSAMPQWDGGWGTQPQTSIGDIVPGSTVVEAHFGGINPGKYVPKYLTMPAAKGVGAPAAVYEDANPPLFYIHNHQLWQPVNTTTVLRVNVQNVTTTPQPSGRGLLSHPAPLRLELSDEKDGVEGRWRWSGTKLFFRAGEMDNKGLYFYCQTKAGVKGIYTSLEGMAAPPGCNYMTLHSLANKQGDKDW